MSDTKPCDCSPASTLVFACSGAADVGEISDLAARQLTTDGVARMFCLAGIGGRVPAIMAAAERADRIVAVDGCPLDCARQTLKLAEISDFAHLRVTDLGLKKGETEVTPETITQVAEKAASLVNAK